MVALRLVKRVTRREKVKPNDRQQRETQTEEEAGKGRQALGREGTEAARSPLSTGHGSERAVPSSGPTSLYTSYRGDQGAVSETLGAPTGCGDGQPPSSRDRTQALPLGSLQGLGS